MVSVVFEILVVSMCRAWPVNCVGARGEFLVWRVIHMGLGIKILSLFEEEKKKRPGGGGQSLSNR